MRAVVPGNVVYSMRRRKSDRKQNHVNILMKPDGILKHNKFIYKLALELN